ncbi:hypothetical protein Hte_008890 [Hypoxylon texense]
MSPPSPQSKRAPEFTTYSNTADCIERALPEENHPYDRGIELLDYFQLTVVQDEVKFSGARTSTVRDHFREWASAPDTLAREQGGVEVRTGLPQRYRYCIRVDAEALDRVSAATVLMDEGGEGSDEISEKKRMNILWISSGRIGNRRFLIGEKSLWKPSKVVLDPTLDG